MYRFVCRGLHNMDYIHSCVNSLKAQTMGDWTANLIVDGSNPNLIVDCKDSRVGVQYQPERHGVCYNMYHGIETCGAQPEDVVCILDLDDKLENKYSLQIVDNYYRKYPNLLCTYGSFVMSGNGKIHKLCHAYPNNADGYIRKWRWHASHLKTFKYKLFRHIPPDYFMHDGKWGQGASDLALMFCVLELAGIKNTHFIKDPIYWYRYPTANNCNRGTQKKWRDIFRKKKPLARAF